MQLVPTLKKRFLFKIIRSSFSALLSLIILPVITRALGPEGFGLFNFLKTIFLQIINYLDIGTSAFYPKISRRPRDLSIIRFVIYYDVILFILTFVLLSLVILTDYSQLLFSTKSSFLILSTFILSWLFVLNQKLISFLDALGKTIVSELLMIFTRLFITLSILILFYFKMLDIINYVNIQNIYFIIVCIILIFISFKYFRNGNNSKNLKEIYFEFKKYSSPLFLASSIGLICSLADRFLLQIYSGSVAQGYYSLSLNIGAICILVTASFTPLLTREYAIAYEDKNIEKIKSLFQKYTPLFFVFTSIISCFISIHSDLFAIIFGGNDFKQASIPIMIMALSPIHQTYGQLSGSIMVATDRTKEYGYLSTIETLIGIPLIYILLMPTAYYGFNLGAIGLAIKVVGLQFLFVNIQLWLNTKFLKISYMHLLLNQIKIVALFMTISLISKVLIFGSFNLESQIMLLTLSLLLYLFLAFFTLYFFPSFISKNRIEIKNYRKRLFNFLIKLFKKNA